MVLPEWTVKVIKNSLHLLLEMSKHFILKKLLMPLKEISKKRILFEHPVVDRADYEVTCIMDTARR